MRMSTNREMHGHGVGKNGGELPDHSHNTAARYKTLMPIQTFLKVSQTSQKTKAYSLFKPCTQLLNGMKQQ